MKNIYSDKIKEIRIKNNLNKKEIAEKLGISARTYAKYENGESKIPIKILIKLCLYYNISADYILGLKKPKE